MRYIAAMLLTVIASSGVALAQKPLPFPKPTDPQKPNPQGSSPVAPPQKPGAPVETAPTEAMLRLPIYPTAEYFAAYDAGRGQRYYLFGTNATFTTIVEYYRSALKQRGELVYDEPPVHMFEVGRFREETMAFYPGVTIKDYGWAGAAGYLNPKLGAEPARFKTIIQLVPPPAPAPAK